MTRRRPDSERPTEEIVEEIRERLEDALESAVDRALVDVRASVERATGARPTPAYACHVPRLTVGELLDALEHVARSTIVQARDVDALGHPTQAVAAVELAGPYSVALVIVATEPPGFTS